MQEKRLKSSTWELLLWLLRKRKRFRVAGDSMLPWLHSGEEILIDPAAYKKFPPKIGDIVVALHPDRPEMRIVKRISLIEEEGYFLLGDNPPESTDSRSFGVVSLNAILGRVTSRFI